MYAGVDSQDNPKDSFKIFKCNEIYIAIFLNVSALEQIAKIENNKTRDSSYLTLLCCLLSETSVKGVRIFMG